MAVMVDFKSLLYEHNSTLTGKRSAQYKSQVNVKSEVKSESPMISGIMSFDEIDPVQIRNLPLFPSLDTSKVTDVGGLEASSFPLFCKFKVTLTSLNPPTSVDCIASSFPLSSYP